MAETKSLPEKLLDEIAVNIDGQTFFVRNPDSVRTLDRMYVDRSVARIGMLLLKDSNTVEEQDEVDRMIARICRIAVDIPDEVFDNLSLEQRQRISDFFVERLYRMTPPAATTTQQNGMRQHKQPTGRKSSRA